MRNNNTTASERTIKWQAKRKAAGLCVTCGEPAREGKVHCERCAAKVAKAGREAYRRRNGIPLGAPRYPTWERRRKPWTSEADWAVIRAMAAGGGPFERAFARACMVAEPEELSRAVVGLPGLWYRWEEAVKAMKSVKKG